MKRIKRKMVMMGTTGVLLAGLLAGSVSGAADVSGEKKTASEVSKVETVYVNADAVGTVSSVTVSDWLKNAGQNRDIPDSSILEDIVNVKGEEAFETSGENGLTWKAEDADIYYQGTTDKALPVQVKLEYSLDGKAAAPKDIVGKSGRLEVKVTYTNTAVEKVKEGKKEKEVSVPFMMVTGIVLPVEKFSNIEIDNGRVISEGSNSILAGVGFPGLAESLDLSEEQAEKIPEGFTFTADVTDFSMGVTFTYASNDVFSKLETEDMKDFDELEDSLKELADSSAKLVTGSEELDNGLKTFDENFATLTKGVKTLAKGTGVLKEGGDTFLLGLTTYTKGTKELIKGTKQYVAGTNTLADGVISYVNGEKELADGINVLASATKNLPASYKKLSDGIKAYVSGVNQIADQENVTKLTNGAAALANGVGSVYAGITGVKGGVSAINEQLATLEATFQNNQKTLDAMRAASDSVTDSGVKSTLQTYISTLETLTKQQENGIKALREASGKGSNLMNGISALEENTGENSDLRKGADTLSTELGKLGEGGSTLVTKGQELLAGNADMQKGIGDVSTAIDSLKNGASKLSKNNSDVTSGAKQLKKSGKQIKQGAKKIKKSTNKLVKGGKDVNAGIGSLETGALELQTGSNKLSEGLQKLVSGAGTLKTGMKKFDGKGIQKIQTAYDENMAGLLANLKNAGKAAGAYKTFSGLADGMDGTVKFIIETAEVK